MRKYTFDINSFYDMTLESCYWAGFIAADGYINKTNNKMSIRLNIKDKDCLEKFKLFLKSDHVIHEYANNTTVDLTIASEKLCKFLNEHFNIINKKSLVLLPPTNLTLDQRLSYIVGYIDGNGSIFFENNKYLVLSVRASIEVSYFIKKEFDKIINSYTNRLPIVTVDTSGYPNYKLKGYAANLVVNELVKLPLPRMSRKWNKPLNLNNPMLHRSSPIYCSNGCVYQTLTEAGNKTGGDPGNIAKAIKNNNKVKGLKFSKSNIFNP